MKKLLTFVMLFTAMLVSAQTDKITIEFLDAEQQVYELSKIHKFVLEDGKFKVVDNTKQVISEVEISSLNKIIFDVSTGVRPVEEIKFDVYPNPTADEVTIHGVEAGAVIRLFTIDGRMLSNTVADNENVNVSVSTLPAGTYLLQVNGNVVKIIKQ